MPSSLIPYDDSKGKRWWVYTCGKKNIIFKYKLIAKIYWWWMINYGEKC